MGKFRNRKTLDEIIPVRLPGDEWEGFRKEASKAGVGPNIRDV